MHAALGFRDVFLLFGFIVWLGSDGKLQKSVAVVHYEWLVEAPKTFALSIPAIALVRHYVSLSYTHATDLHTHCQCSWQH